MVVNYCLIDLAVVNYRYIPTQLKTKFKKKAPKVINYCGA